MNEFALKTPNSLSKVKDQSPNLEANNYNSGLRALLTFRDIGFVLENHYARILKIENRAKEMGQSTLTAIEANCPAESFEKLQSATNTIIESVHPISKLLNAVKEKIAKKDRSDATELWNRFDQESETLRKNFTNLEDLGLALLPENMLLSWKESVNKFRANLLPYIFSYAKACRIELKMI